MKGLSLLFRHAGDRADTTEQGEKVEADHWCCCSPSGRRTHPSTSAIASRGTQQIPDLAQQLARWTDTDPDMYSTPNIA